VGGPNPQKSGRGSGGEEESKQWPDRETGKKRRFRRFVVEKGPQILLGIHSFPRQEVLSVSQKIRVKRKAICHYVWVCGPKGVTRNIKQKPVQFHLPRGKNDQKKEDKNGCRRGVQGLKVSSGVILPLSAGGKDTRRKAKGFFIQVQRKKFKKKEIIQGKTVPSGEDQERSNRGAGPLPEEEEQESQSEHTGR